MIINELSNFLINFHFKDIPKESVEKAKLCFLDYIAVYKRGLLEEDAKIAIKTLSNPKLGLNRDDNILADGLIRGIASHSLDLDDGHKLAFLHPGVVIFSTALAIISNKKLKEEYVISTENFFEAVIGAYEVAVTLGKLVNPDHRNQGFHSTGTVGSFVAGAVAVKLLKLNFNEMINCLGLCGTQSAGFLESNHTGGMAKTLHSGKAVYNGLLSAFLAKNGFKGSESIIEGKEGFLNNMVSNFNFINFDFNRFLDENLGKFHINDVYFKKYPFCRHIHSSIDATLNLRNNLDNLMRSINFTNNVDLNDLIIKIKIETYRIASEHDNYNPKTKSSLKQSLPYAIAIYLVCGDLSLDDLNILINKGLFEENIQKDDEIKSIKDIVDKIDIYESREFESLTPYKRASKVSIKLNDSLIEDDLMRNIIQQTNDEFSEDDNVLEKTIFYPLGESENPLLWDDILNKFSSLNSSYDLDKLKIIKNMENENIDKIIKLI